MTFAIDKINSWIIEKEKTLKIIAHGQEFEYKIDKSFKEFKKYLVENLAKKK